MSVTVSCTSFLVISSLKIPKGFLICSSAQQNFAYTFMLTFPTDLLSQIFKLISNGVISKVRFMLSI